MKQSVQAPIVTKSENWYRGANRWASANFTKRQREAVRLVLDSTMKRPPMHITDRHACNSFRVTFCRISAGCLDFANLVGAMKGVEDEVAAWLGLDDRDARFRVVYREQQCPTGYIGLRITIEDLEDPHVETSKVLGASPRVLGPVSEPGSRGRGGRGSMGGLPAPAGPSGARSQGAPRAPRDGSGSGDDHAPHAGAPSAARSRGARRIVPSRELPFARCFALYPWDGPGVVTELPDISGAAEPPPAIVVDEPTAVTVREYTGAARITVERTRRPQRVVLYRARYRDPSLGDIFLYTVDGHSTYTGDE